MSVNTSGINEENRRPEEKSAKEKGWDTGFGKEDKKAGQKTAGTASTTKASANAKTASTNLPPWMASQASNPGATAVAGDFPLPPGISAEVQDFINNLLQQGYSAQQIAQQLPQKFGLSTGEAQYLTQGFAGLASNMSGDPTYKAFGQDPFVKNYQNNATDAYFNSVFDQMIAQQTQQKVNKQVHQGKMKSSEFNMMMAAVLSGDLALAMHIFFSRIKKDTLRSQTQVLTRLNQLRNYKNDLTKKFAGIRFPVQSPGEDPETAARVAAEARKKTQMSQMLSTLQGDAQSSIQQLMQMLQSMQRFVQDMLQLLTSISRAQEDSRGRIARRN